MKENNRNANDRQEQLKSILFGSPSDSSNKIKSSKLITNSDVEKVNTASQSIDIPAPEKESTLSGKLSFKERAMTGTIAGLPAATAGVNPKEATKISADILPILGQMIGGMAGGPQGGQMGKFAGSVAGTGVGLAGKEMIEMMEGEDFKISDIGIDTGVTAAFEAATRIPAAALFGKARAIDEIREGAGKMVNVALEKLSELSQKNPQLRQSSSKILNIIDDTLSKVIDRSGKQGALINRWRRVFSQGPSVMANALIQFERRLGDVIDFGNVPGEVKNTAMNNAIKALRNKISGIVDNLAENAAKYADTPSTQKALREFRKNSKRVHAAFQALEKRNPGMIERIVQGGLAGAMTGGLTKNPLIGALAGEAAFEAGSKGARQAAYQAIEKTGIGRGITLATSDFARKARQKFLSR